MDSYSLLELAERVKIQVREIARLNLMAYYLLRGSRFRGGIWIMVSSIRILVLSLLTLALGAASANSEAASSGKIYLGGKWVDSDSTAFKASSALPGFGPLILQGGNSDHKNEVLSFLRGNSLLLGNLSQISWKEPTVQLGSELETHRVRKSWNGLEVMGGEAVVHLKQGQLAFASADETPLGHLSAAPLVAANQASQIAFSSYRGNALKASTPELKVLVLGRTGEKEARLVYAVTVTDIDELTSDIHFIDAYNGQEAMVTTNVQTISTRRVLSGTGTRDDMAIVTNANAEQMISERFKTVYDDGGCAGSGGGFSFWESWKRAREESPAAGNTSCATLDAPIMTSALSAFSNSGMVLDYFKSAHRRNSVDGAGLAIRSVVNFGGASFHNAAWYNDRRIMLYGMGDGERFNDFASSLDVVAHEITHGLTSNTAALVYSSESGALNESFSDVFGKLVAFRSGRNADWKIGRDLFRDGTSFIRDMENPDVAHTKDFKYRNETCTRFNDSCGVHDNSGIPNKAATIIAKRLGNEKTGRLYFLTLTQLLRSSSDFREARAQTEAACATLFGRSPDCQVVSDAFTAVGI